MRANIESTGQTVEGVDGMGASPGGMATGHVSCPGAFSGRSCNCSFRQVCSPWLLLDVPTGRFSCLGAILRSDGALASVRRWNIVNSNLSGVCSKGLEAKGSSALLKKRVGDEQY